MRKTVTIEVDADEELVKKLKAAERKVERLEKKVRDQEISIGNLQECLKALQGVRDAVSSAAWTFGDDYDYR